MYVQHTLNAPLSINNPSTRLPKVILQWAIHDESCGVRQPARFTTQKTVKYPYLRNAPSHRGAFRFRYLKTASHVQVLTVFFLHSGHREGLSIQDRRYRSSCHDSGHDNNVVATRIVVLRVSTMTRWIRLPKRWNSNSSHNKKVKNTGITHYVRAIENAPG